MPNTRGKRKHTKKKKTYLTLFPRERNTIYDIKERAKRSEPTQSMLFSITDSFGFAKVCLCLFIIVGSRSFPLALSLARAQKEERTRPKTNEGKCAHAHTQTQARARTGKTESDIQIRVFSHSRLTQNRSVDYVHRHLRDRSRQIRTRFPSARAFYDARAYLATRPRMCIFFLRASKSVTP